MGGRATLRPYWLFLLGACGGAIASPEQDRAVVDADDDGAGGRAAGGGATVIANGGSGASSSAPGSTHTVQATAECWASVFQPVPALESTGAKDACGTEATTPATLDRLVGRWVTCSPKKQPRGIQIDGYGRFWYLAAAADGSLVPMQLSGTLGVYLSEYQTFEPWGAASVSTPPILGSLRVQDDTLTVWPGAAGATQSFERVAPLSPPLPPTVLAGCSLAGVWDYFPALGKYSSSALSIAFDEQGRFVAARGIGADPCALDVHGLYAILDDELAAGFLTYDHPVELAECHGYEMFPAVADASCDVVTLGKRVDAGCTDAHLLGSGGTLRRRTQ
jgi:hypothetical protein